VGSPARAAAAPAGVRESIAGARNERKRSPDRVREDFLEFNARRY
jgi:hypothetical protein